MIVMPANATGAKVGYVARQYERSPARLGHLYSPGAQVGPYPFLPYALDNGAFGAFTRGVEWDPVPWLDLLIWARQSGQAPLWVLVPDVVGDRTATLRRWDAYATAAAQFGWPLAFAAQDGMTPTDVPAEATTVFIGGSTEWKWSHLTEVVRRVSRSRPRRSGERAARPASLRRSWRGLVRRHRVFEDRTPMEPPDPLPRRASRRGADRRTGVVVVRRFRRDDGAWIEVVQSRRSGAMWRREVKEAEDV